MPLRLPGWENAASIPIVGPIYSFVLGGHNLLVYVAFLAVPLAWWVLYRTRFGLRLRGLRHHDIFVATSGGGGSGASRRAGEQIGSFQINLGRGLGPARARQSLSALHRPLCLLELRLP